MIVVFAIGWAMLSILFIIGAEIGIDLWKANHHD